MNKNTILLSLFILSGCGYTNVSSEWDCPKLNGYKCMTIRAADKNDEYQQDTSRVRWNIHKEKGPFGSVHTIVPEEIIE